jgi:hypothetical protein
VNPWLQFAALFGAFWALALVVVAAAMAMLCTAVAIRKRDPDTFLLATLPWAVIGAAFAALGLWLKGLV